MADTDTLTTTLGALYQVPASSAVLTPTTTVLSPYMIHTWYLVQACSSYEYLLLIARCVLTPVMSYPLAVGIISCVAKYSCVLAAIPNFDDPLPSCAPPAFCLCFASLCFAYTPSESQGLLQAAAGSGFIGFSAFQTPASPSSTIPPTPGALTGGAGSGTARVRPGGAKGSAFGGSKRGIKTARADGGYSPGALGQVGAVGGRGRGVGVEV